jgi:hypothetical protein
VINKDSCDLIVFKDGSEVRSKIIKISDDIIEFKQCNNLNGPAFELSTSKISWIELSNGERYTPQQDNKIDEKKVNEESMHNPMSFIFGILSLILTMLGAFLVTTFPIHMIFLFLGLITGIAAFSSGINGQKYKRNGLGIFGIIAGSIAIVMSIIYGISWMILFL